MELGPQNSAPPRVEAYLDQVLAPLTRRLSAFHQQELRRELRAHLGERISAYQELGITEDNAVTEALRQFGGAEDFLQQWQQEWTKTTPQATLREIGVATRTALLLSLPALLIACLGWPDWAHPHSFSANQFAWAPDWMRWCQLSYVASGWASFSLDFVLLPVAVGAAMGRFVPRHAGLGMLSALAAIIVLTDWCLLPNAPNLGQFLWDSSYLLFVLGFYWLPVACTTAAMASWWTQRQRKVLA